MIKIARNKKAFNTTINSEVLEAYQKKCDDEGKAYNEVVEIAMQAYAEGKFYTERIVTIKK